MSDPAAEVVAGLAQAAEIRDRTAAVLAEDLYWFPVRHHSPAVAHYLDKAIRKRRPKVIFLEAPSEAQDLTQFIVSKGTRPPVAVFTSFRDDDNVLELAGIASEAEDIPPKFPAWYPLTTYSPEYVTLCTAAKLGIEVVFMDLPHYAMAGLGPKHILPKTDGDAYLARTDFYTALARAGGYRTWSEGWDTLFERDTLELETYRRELATFCAAARATTDPTTIASDDTLPRERYMWRTIQQTLKARGLSQGDAMVVCGGFHLFLDRDDREPPPELPQGTVHCTLVPYSWYRLSELSGYGAGNRAPRFYLQQFEDRKAGRPSFETVATHAVGILKQARKKGEHLAAADTIAVVHHAHLLAQLRGRPEPVLDDLHDALITCCVKGDPQTDGAPLRAAIVETDIGTRVGKVSDKVGRLPIVDDYYSELDRLELSALLGQEKFASLTLDKRKPEDSERSTFLHRVLYLGVPVGEVKRSGDVFGQSIFKEHWRLGWTPKIDNALVERSLDGDTVQAASLNRLTEELAGAQYEAGRCCRTLVNAVDMELGAMVLHAEQAAGDAIDRDQRFFSLADAVSALVVLDRYAAYRALGRTGLTELIERAYNRACFALPDAAAIPDEDHPPLFNGLRVLGELVMQRESLDADRFGAYCRTAADLSTIARLRGAFLGIVVEIKQLDASVLADEMRAYAAARPEVQLEMGDFLDGVLSVSRLAVLLGAKDLVQTIDGVLAEVEHETFMAMAPRLRTALAKLHDRQRSAFAEQVATLHGLGSSEQLTEQLHISSGAAALVAELDAQTARIIDGWAFG